MRKLSTPDNNRVNRSQFGRATALKQDINDYIGDNCYIPTSGNYFIKCFNQITGNDYTEGFLTFIRTEQKRSNVMTSARSLPFCKNRNISQ